METCKTKIEMISEYLQCNDITKTQMNKSVKFDRGAQKITLCTLCNVIYCSEIRFTGEQQTIIAERFRLSKQKLQISII